MPAIATFLAWATRHTGRPGREADQQRGADDAEHGRLDHRPDDLDIIGPSQVDLVLVESRYRVETPTSLRRAPRCGTTRYTVPVTAVEHGFPWEGLRRPFETICPCTRSRSCPPSCDDLDAKREGFDRLWSAGRLRCEPTHHELHLFLAGRFR